MSFVARRGLSTLIPPKVASPNAIGAAKDAMRMSRISRFYEGLPRGAAPVERPMNPLDMYRVRHFGDKPSAWPLYHTIAFIMILGYAEAYYFHLRHHKNNAH